MSENTASLKDVMAYFNMTPAEFTPSWRKMTTEDKAQIRDGIGNGSLTY